MDFSVLVAQGHKGRIKVAAVMTIILFVTLVVLLDLRKRQSDHNTAQLGANGQQTEQERKNAEKAQDVIRSVRKLFAIPADLSPSVAAVVNAEELRKNNIFYQKAENGHFIVATTDRAILFDPAKNIIIDVMPIAQTAVSSSSASSSKQATR